MDRPILSDILNGIVLILELALSLGVGIFYAIRQKTSEEYIHGSHKMSLLPVCISMAVTFTSAVSIQGFPAEVYVYGMEFYWYSFGYLGGILVIFTFLPIFFQLKLTSVYQYFTLRYNNPVLAKCASFVGCLVQIAYSAMVVLAPAEAMESLFGIPTVYNILIISSICVIYTSLGGIQGVIWTDVLQAIIMLCGITSVILFGLIKIGFNSIWQELSENGRTTINYSPDIRNRTSIWLFLYNLTVGYHVFTTQPAVARYTGVKTIKQAQFSIIFGCLGILVFNTFSISAGAVVFAFYSKTGCGPLESKEISSANQILPYFVMNELDYPGLPGLFVAALIAAGLSTASSAINATAIVCLQEFVLPLYPNVSEKNKNIILKVTVLVVGSITVGVSYICQFAPGSIIQVFAAIVNTLAAPVGTAFIIAATVPFSNHIPVIIGGIFGLILPMWISIGSMITNVQWEKSAPINGRCVIDNSVNVSDVSLFSIFNSTSIQNSNVTSEHDLFYGLYSICPYSYSLISSAVTFIVGTSLSLLPCFRIRDTIKIDQSLLFPIVRKYGYTKSVLDDNPEQSVKLESTL